MRSHLAFLLISPKHIGLQEPIDLIKVNSSVCIYSKREREHGSNTKSMQKLNKKRARRCKSIDELGDLPVKQNETGLIYVPSPKSKWKNDGKGKEK